MNAIRSVITGTGKYIPTEIKTNREFEENTFKLPEGDTIITPINQITEKFQQITGIKERRYAAPHLNASDIGVIAAKAAINDAGIDKEQIDQIIVAQNFGDIPYGTIQSDMLPSIASRVKNLLDIKNPNTVPYDLIFGCPGWVQGLIQAEAFIKSGQAKTCLVIGTETLSRIIDDYDRDSMIFSDGAGACIVEGREVTDRGILSTATQSHCGEETYYLHLGKSNFPDANPKNRYIKMNGRKVYEYAIRHVPGAMKVCLEKSGKSVKDLKKIFIHQANEKLDEAIVHRFYKSFDLPVPEDIMPMNIHTFGNSSVATIPTLLDMVRKESFEGHEIKEGDLIMFASVGAGMNINAVCYQV